MEISQMNLLNNQLLHGVLIGKLVSYNRNAAEIKNS